MRLQDELDAVRSKRCQSTPSHISRVRKDAIDDLISSGVAERAIQAGEPAPEFQLPDRDGVLLSSSALLKRGPVLIIFYRGRWCPYCLVDLRANEDVAQQFRSRGASIISISQQTAHESRCTEEMNNLSFPSLIDRGGEVAHAFGLRWKLSQELRSVELERGLDLPSINGEPSWTLTMPARYVLGPSGIVEYADISADYTRRSDPTELFPVLSRIRGPLMH